MSFQYLPEQQAEKKGPDQTLLIVGALLALMVCGGLVVVAAYFLRPRSANQAVNFSIPTAREAYPAAVAVIRANDVGSQLVSAAGAWTPMIDQGLLRAGRTGWTFYFYMPTTHQMAAVVADRASGARIVSTQKWQTPPDVYDDQGWQADSGAGMDTFLQTCQSQISGDRQVVVRLTTIRANGAPVWQYQVVSPDQQTICGVNIDARTGVAR